MIVLAKFHLIPMSGWKVFLESAICNFRRLFLKTWKVAHRLPGSHAQPFNYPKNCFPFCPTQSREGGCS